MTQQTKRVIWYGASIMFVLAAMTTAVKTVSVWSQDKAYCYKIREGEPIIMGNCQCPCPIEDRDSSGMYCKRCEHYVEIKEPNFNAGETQDEPVGYEADQD